MAGARRTKLSVEADRRNREQLARAGGDLRRQRIQRRWTQQRVGDRAGVGRMVVGRIERGLGGGVTLDAWQRVALAVESPLIIRLQRDLDGETADVAHLRMQELVLKLGRRAGYRGAFELSTRPAESWRSSDAGLRDDVRRRLVLVECWNTIGDVGAAARSSARKRTEAETLATALWGTAEHVISAVWVVRSTGRNRNLVARYPEVFAARFPASSAAWVAALQTGSPPPTEPGLVWCDLGATRIFAWRRSRAGLRP